MRIVLKLLAAPFALAFTILAALFSFILSMSDVIFGILSGLSFIVAVALFITGQTTGGIAFIVIAFLVSPAGIPALAGLLAKGLNSMGGGLRAFLRS